MVVFESGKLGYEVENDCCEVGKNDIIVVGERHPSSLPSSDRFADAKPGSVVLSFLPQTVHQGAPLGDDFQYLMPFSTYGAVVPNVIRARAGLTREILDLVDRVRHELPGDTEHSRLAIRTYLKMILLVLVGHCSEYGDARAAFSKQREARERLAPVFRHLATALRRTDPRDRCGAALRSQLLLLHESV